MLIVVYAQCVVAETRQPSTQLLGVGRAHVVRREAEVHPVEALLDAGSASKLEMVAFAHDASVFPGGSVDPTGGGEVESGAGLDVRCILDRHPCVVRPHNVFAVPVKGRDAAHRHRECPLFTGAKLSIPDHQAKQKDWIAPLAVVLRHAPRWLAELYANGRTSGSGDLQRIASCIAQLRNAIVLR